LNKGDKMFTLPDFFYVKAFWEALSFSLAGLAALLAYFGVIPVEWAVGSGVLLSWFLAILKLFGVVPELRMREAIKNSSLIKNKKSK
jgi:hypothetical protein